MILDIFTEDEMLRMPSSSYSLLKGMLGDFTAQAFKDYMEDPSSNPEVVELIRSNMGKEIESLTYLRNLKVSSGLDKVKHQYPEFIPNLDINIDEVAKELEEIQEKRKHLNHSVIPCTGEDFKAFVESLKALDDGSRRPPLYKVVKTNSSLFYSPNAPTRQIHPYFSNTDYEIWEVKLKALKYLSEARKVSNGKVFPRWIA